MILYSIYSSTIIVDYHPDHSSLTAGPSPRPSCPSISLRRIEMRNLLCTLAQPKTAAKPAHEELEHAWFPRRIYEWVILFFGIYCTLIHWMVKQVSTYFSQRESTGFEILVGFETAAESPGECRRAQERRVGQKRGTSHPDFRVTRGPRIWVNLSLIVQNVYFVWLSMGMNQTQ